MTQLYLGIDISKATFDVWLVGGKKAAGARSSNDAVGYRRLKRRAPAHELHVCMEATGRYWEALALFLSDEGYAVSVVNPKLVKRRAEAVMQRNKTDAQDARTIADYCRK